MGVVIGLAIIALILYLVYLAHKAKIKRLLAAPRGSIRVETIKANRVNNTVNEYARCGWKVTQQSSAKSLGSQAQVTLTFQKG